MEVIFKKEFLLQSITLDRHFYVFSFISYRAACRVLSEDFDMPPQKCNAFSEQSQVVFIF